MSSQQIPQMSGMPQIVEMTPTAAEIEAAAEVKTARYSGVSNIVTVPSIGTVIAPAGAMANNDIIRLSKNMKLRMAHRGFKEIAQDWKTADTYEEVTAGSSTVWKFVAKDARPALPIADTDCGFVVTDPGTFTTTTGYKTKDYAGADLIPFEDNLYAGNPSSSSANAGLVGPDIWALAADQVVQRDRIIDNPGRTGGEAMDDDNYMTLPGRIISTATTAMAAIAKVEAARGQVLLCAALTSQDLLNCGISANTIKWTTKEASYKNAILISPDEMTLQNLQQLLVTVNAT